MLLIELYMPELGMSRTLDQLFSDRKRRLDRVLRYMEDLVELQGVLDLVLLCCNREDEKSSKVEHRLVQIPVMVKL